MTDAEKLVAIAHLCRRKATPASAPSTHHLANRVLAIIDPDGAHAAVVELTEPRTLPTTTVRFDDNLTLGEILALDISTDDQPDGRG